MKQIKCLTSTQTRMCYASTPALSIAFWLVTFNFPNKRNGTINEVKFIVSATSDTVQNDVLIGVVWLYSSSLLTSSGYSSSPSDIEASWYC